MSKNDVKHRFSSSALTGAFAATFTTPTQVDIFQIKFTSSTAGQGSDTFTANIVSGAAGIPPGPIVTAPMSGSTSAIQSFDPPIRIFPGDQIAFAYPNSGNANVGAEMVYEKVI